MSRIFLTLWPFLKLANQQRWFLTLGALLHLVTVLATIGLMTLAGLLISGAAKVSFISATLSLAAGANLLISFNYFLPSAGIRFFAMLKIISRYGERIVSHDATFRLLAHLRVWLFSTLIPNVSKLFLQYRSGDLLNRFIHDIDILNQFYLRVVIPCVVIMIALILVTILLSMFSLFFALIFLIIILFSIMAVSTFAVKAGLNPGKIIVTQQRTLRMIVVDTFTNIKDVLFYQQQALQLQRWQAEQKLLLSNQIAVDVIRGVSIASLQSITSFVSFLILYWGAFYVHTGSLQGPYLGMILLAMLAVFEVIAPLPLVLQNLGKTVFSAQRLLDIEQVHQYSQCVKKQTLSNNFDLVIKNLEFAYQNDQASILQNMSLDIKYGSRVAILGETGRGKSTLLHLLRGSLLATKGQIFLGETELSDYSAHILAQAICLIEQKGYLFNATLRENLLIGNPKASDEQLWQVLEHMELKQRFAQLESGLETYLGELGYGLSGGEAKRLNLCRALLKNAPITLLDEPTEGLDDAMAKRIWQVLDNYFSNKTLIFVTHKVKQCPFITQKIQI